MSADGGGILVGALCFAFYALATVELLALLGGSASLPFVKPVAPESLAATGLPRAIGIALGVVLAVATQVFVAYLLFARSTETALPTKILLVAELAAAGTWTRWLVRASSGSRSSGRERR